MPKKRKSTSSRKRRPKDSKKTSIPDAFSFNFDSATTILEDSFQDDKWQCSVTVYSGLAEVTRTITCQTEKSGLVALELSATNESELEPNSFRVSAPPPTKNATSLTVLECVTSTAHHASQSIINNDEKRSKIALLNEEKEALSLQHAQATLVRQRFERLSNLAESFFARLSSHPASNHTNTTHCINVPSAQEMNLFSKVLETRESALTRFSKAIQQATEKQRILSEKLNLAQRSIDAISQGNDDETRKRFKITIYLFVHEPGQVRINLSYLVKKASWIPSYDVRVNSAAEVGPSTAQSSSATSAQGVDVVYYASIQQNSGEDWTNARLKLSTANPHIDGTPPLMEPKRLHLKPQYIMKKRKQLGGLQLRGMALNSLAAPTSELSLADAGFDDASSDDDDECAELEVEMATVEKGATSVSFSVPHPCTVESDNKPHKITIAMFSLDYERAHVAVPKKSEQVFQIAETTNTSEYPILSGEMNLFLDNNFCSTTHMDTVPVGSSFKLPLGVDNSVRLIYPADKRRREDTGSLFSKRTTFTMQQKFSVHNTSASGRVHQLTIHDVIPKPTDSEISVKLQYPKMSSDQTQKEIQHNDSAPTMFLLKEKENKLKWNVVLEPSEKKDFSFCYSIEVPRDRFLAG
eukprot:CAMPEP_0201548618 /NCGR_PEP_ID=MMETSP0173_2-20130828/5151_1 /ASSEMBLY_ACC=CAM_ASM_000268 /TAXON_ID=218659 /ORGANISM="Vexillifera sp., Strain DIVA3 564/2" /LENGTH=637 /DNA_ID=CAMNT_0047958055 /DNA_START=1283 /DNA_END=3193 /DNA_ORIENTATION=-